MPQGCNTQCKSQTDDGMHWAFGDSREGWGEPRFVAFANFCGVNTPTMTRCHNLQSWENMLAISSLTSWKEPAPVPTGCWPNSAHGLVLFGQETVGPHSVFKNQTN